MKIGLNRFLGLICLLFFLETAFAENINSKCPCGPKPPTSPPTLNLELQR
jgi:hypothetical protein